MHRGFSVQSSQVFYQPNTYGRPEGPPLPHDLNEQRRIEAELGEAMRFSTPFSVECATYTLVRKPEGSDCAISGVTLSGPDKPGVYTVVCELDGHWTRTLDVCAFHPRQVFGSEQHSGEERTEIRKQFRGWINDPARTQSEIVERLEDAETLANLLREKPAETSVPHRQPAPTKHARASANA